MKKIAVLMLFPLWLIAAEPKVGISEAELISIKGKPSSSLAGPKKTIYKWPDLTAEVINGKVSNLESSAPKPIKPISEVEIELMRHVIDMQNQIGRAKGLSLSDYLEVTDRIIDQFKDAGDKIENQKFKYEFNRYLQAHLILRNIVKNMSFEKTATKESFYWVRKKRDPEAYRLISEIAQTDRNKIDRSWGGGGEAFDVYDLNPVNSHIDTVYWGRVMKTFQESVDQNQSRDLKEVPPPLQEGPKITSAGQSDAAAVEIDPGENNREAVNINPAGWTQIRPFGNSEINFWRDRIELHSRGTIASKISFKKATVYAVGQFKDSQDVFDVYLRANPACTNPHGVPDGGIVIHFDIITHTIFGFSWDWSGDKRQDFISAPMNLGVGQKFDFKITDDGTNVKVFLNKNSAPVIQFKTKKSLGDKVVIQNRESGHTFTLWQLEVKGF